MGLLDNISNTSNKLYSKLGGISSKVEGFSNIAKGVLCFPTLISGALSSIPGLIGNITSGVGLIINSTVNSIFNNIQNAVSGAIQDTVDNINGRISTLTSAVNSITGNILGFAKGLESQVLDVLNFVPSKENCQFAAAELNKCVTKQAVNSISNKQLRNIAAGIVDINTVSAAITRNVNTSTGPIAGIANKQVKQLNRASAILNKAGKII